MYKVKTTFRDLQQRGRTYSEGEVYQHEDVSPERLAHLVGLGYLEKEKPKPAPKPKPVEKKAEAKAAPKKSTPKK